MGTGLKGMLSKHLTVSCPGQGPIDPYSATSVGEVP